MAKITIASNEIEQTIEVVEKLFVGLNLSPIKNIVNSLSITGNVIITEKLKSDNFVLNIEIIPPIEKQQDLHAFRGKKPHELFGI